MRSLLLDRPGTPTTGAGGGRRNPGEWLFRAALHIAVWFPFITTAADSWRGPWRPVGDNARLALQSWNTLSGQLPLVGQPNELPGAPHDLGPIQYWLLSIPVHLDLSRGVLWGAVLLAMLAASLTIEAVYSVLGKTGGLLACGFVLAILAWFPGFINRPEDNPNFGLIWFIPTLALGLAVLSGRRKWWPVLVVAASIATQAHLTFAAASVLLVAIALVAALIDERRDKDGSPAKRRYRWLIIGLVAGVACWVAPLAQQFGSRPGAGNMYNLLHAERGGQHVGTAFAMKALATLAIPSPLWWKQNVATIRNLFAVLGTKPAFVGILVLLLTAASLVLAIRWLRSRVLASLAGIALLVTVCADSSFALIPGHAGALAGQQHDLVFALFVAVLLAWLTVICTAILAARKLIGDRRAGEAANEEPVAEEPASATRSARPRVIPVAVPGLAALLLVIGVLLGTQQIVGYSGAGSNSLHVGQALATIGRTVPKQQAFGLSVISPKRDKFQLVMGLCYALVSNGFRADTFYPSPMRQHGSLPGEAVVIHGLNMTVERVRITAMARDHWRNCNGPFS